MKNLLKRLFKNNKPILKTVPTKNITLTELFDVEKFNEWFNNPNNGSYANKGIFLRTDKLDDSFFMEYFKFHGVQDAQNEAYADYNSFVNFKESVRKDWMKRLNG